MQTASLSQGSSGCTRPGDLLISDQRWGHRPFHHLQLENPLDLACQWLCECSRKTVYAAWKSSMPLKQCGHLSLLSSPSEDVTGFLWLLADVVILGLHHMSLHQRLFYLLFDKNSFKSLSQFVVLFRFPWHSHFTNTLHFWFRWE